MNAILQRTPSNDRLETLLEVPSMEGIATQIQSKAVRGEWAHFLHTILPFAVENMPKIWHKSSGLQQLVICRLCKPRDVPRCLLRFIGDQELFSTSDGEIRRGGEGDQGSMDSEARSKKSIANLCFSRHVRPFSFIETLYDHVRGLSTGIPFLLYSNSIGFDVMNEVQELAHALGHAPMIIVSASSPVVEILSVLRDAGDRGKCESRAKRKYQP